VGTCRIGRGGALLESGSVTPGMEGIRGGRESAVAVVAKTADKMVLESILNEGRMNEDDLRGFERL
jgi:hypothetical protein